MQNLLKTIKILLKIQLFILGCVNIIPNIYLQKAYKNLAIHESALPLGKGFSPLSWQIIEGENQIVCLFEANNKVNWKYNFKDLMSFDSHELIDELDKNKAIRQLFYA